MAGPDSKIKEVSLGLCNYMNGRQQVIDLNLAEPCRYFRGKPDQASSSYPCNPYLQCPRLMWVTEMAQFAPRAASAGLIHDFTLTGSLFYYRRQNVGEEHQELMDGDLDQIFSPFAQDKLMVSDLQAPSIPGFELLKCFAAIITRHPDLYHEFEDPNLTISVGQINFEIAGRIKPY